MFARPAMFGLILVATVGLIEGNYEDYEADRHKRLGSVADTPHRIRYKPLTRG